MVIKQVSGDNVQSCLLSCYLIYTTFDKSFSDIQFSLSLFISILPSPSSLPSPSLMQFTTIAIGPMVTSARTAISQKGSVAAQEDFSQKADNVSVFSSPLLSRQFLLPVVCSNLLWGLINLITLLFSPSTSPHHHTFPCLTSRTCTFPQTFISLSFILHMTSPFPLPPCPPPPPPPPPTLTVGHCSAQCT